MVKLLSPENKKVLFELFFSKLGMFNTTTSSSEITVLVLIPWYNNL